MVFVLSREYVTPSDRSVQVIPSKFGVVFVAVILNGKHPFVELSVKVGKICNKLSVSAVQPNSFVTVP